MLYQVKVRGRVVYTDDFKNNVPGVHGKFGVWRHENQPKIHISTHSLHYTSEWTNLYSHRVRVNVHFIYRIRFTFQQ